MANTKLTDEWGKFTALPNEFIEQAGPLSDHARWMFVLLRYHTNSATGTAFPSYEQIKAQTGWAYNTIAKAIRNLEEAGWLTRKKQFSGVTHYTLIRRVQSLPLARTEEKSQSLLMTSPCQWQGQSLPLASTVLANSKPNKTEITKTEITKTEVVVAPAEPVQATTTTGETPAEIYASIAGRLLAIREIELIEAKVPDSEAQAFKEWLTGWSATYGTKAVFKVLEAYHDHKSNRRPTRPAGQLVGVNSQPVLVTGLDRNVIDTVGGVSPAVVSRTGAKSACDVDADALRRRRDEADAAHRAEIRARVETFTRAQQANHAGSCGVHAPAPAGGDEMVVPF